MPVPATVPAPLRAAAFLGSDAVRGGLLTQGQLRSQVWRRIWPDVYVHRDVPWSHGLRVRGAALRWPDAVVTGRSAAVVWGVALAGPDDDVEITLPTPANQVRVPGLRVRRADVDAKRVLRHDRLWVASPEQTAVELAGTLPLDDGVAAVDQMVVAGGADLAEVRWLAGAALGPGSRRARRACALADGLAESPQETRVRLLIGRSQLPAPVAQHRIVDAGRFIARVDFGWPAQRLALEYDGLWHAEPGQFARDRERLNRLREAGWQVVFVTARDLDSPDRLIARIAAALAVGR
ncbi:hypothetical protein O2W18_03085 [Modestobacter sp. VKM Ac-2983]|uniref:endonuclease domain-containing protein n=1 Tax=Modestobacter sp. VKM Ac-2983 TaxID=3004137 RepID=UPI0022AB6D1E|nr:hypothetical protein [Modestobacter sp. VKM Ac-2983]MCZ2804080.1 hypothetical protein [Modestobacter sp. VKM Ac-2983]